MLGVLGSNLICVDHLRGKPFTHKIRQNHWSSKSTGCCHCPPSPIRIRLDPLAAFPMIQHTRSPQSPSTTPDSVPISPSPSSRAGIEDSILLRVLVQALVIVGITSTDIAAVDIDDSAMASFWAIPLSIAGSIWSWRNRRKRNITAKFLIAIGMLLALALFLSRLLSFQSDTRLILLSLLIQLQVLHSFDLPRRKDLGYSTVIGLILIGVAAILSQTVVFGVFLLLFLAIALPVLILDYRSRLGLITQIASRKQRLVLLGNDLSPKRLGTFLGVVLAMGLVIFVCLPRFPSYQIRTFPVSAPIQLENQFNNRQIINPGYSRAGRQQGTNSVGAGGGIGDGQGNAPGKVDELYYYGFNTSINQNLRGVMKPRIVMRVRSQAPGFWRVMAFDQYTGQGWEVSRNNRTQTLSRPRWLSHIALPRLLSQSRTREVIQTYTIVANLPNLVAAMAQPEDLYFPTDEVAIDTEGGVRSPVPLTEGLTYTVISKVPYRDRTQLRSAPSTYPNIIQKYYLPVPAEIAPSLRQETERILSTSPKLLTDNYEKALYLAQYLKQRYTIQPDLPFFSDKEDVSQAFLFKYNGGYPDHFSTTLTMMLRSIGIPARLAVGFGTGQFNPFTGLYVVKNTDAYAITEVYFPQHGWFGFNPIPGYELLPPSPEDDYTFSFLKAFWQWIAGFLPSPVVAWLNDVFTLLGEAIARFVGWLLGILSQGWLGAFAGLILTVVTAFLGWLGWNGWESWRYRRALAKMPPMESLYRQMLHWLAAQGLGKHPAQTPFEYMQGSRSQHPPDRFAIIEAISAAYVRWRYGGQSPENLEQLQQGLQTLRRSPRKPKSQG